MSLEVALAKSCNPVFARVAMQHLSPDILSSYAERFGFNHPLAADVPVMLSVYDAPGSDYEFARTAAGFGDVTLSPLHAASLMAMVAHDGKQVTPQLISHISGPDGSELYQAPELGSKQIILPSTAKQLMEMMAMTTTQGTARKQFKRSRRLRNMQISGKTGTLSGDAPKGRYYWFVGAAPAASAEIAVAALVIDPGGARINGYRLGTSVPRALLQAEGRMRYLWLLVLVAACSPAIESSTSGGVELGPEYVEYRKENTIGAPREENLGTKIFYYLPNRLLDIYDIFRVDAGLGPSFGAVLRITQYGQVGYRVMSPVSLRAGLRGRDFPVFIESSNEFGAGPAFVSSDDRYVTPIEIGLGADLLLAGAYAGISLDEIWDFIAGVFTFDPAGDDIR